LQPVLPLRLPSRAIDSPGSCSIFVEGDNRTSRWRTPRNRCSAPTATCGWRTYSDIPKILLRYSYRLLWVISDVFLLYLTEERSVN
jgi:hypothetical protein